jgi:Na+/proline symporter
LWACLIGGSTLVLTSLTTDQALLQRLFTTRSTKDCKQSIILQALVNVPITLLLNGVGVALFVFYSYHRASLAGLNSPDAILPFFAVTQLPSGISGLIIAAIFAASMGVMSAGINSLSTATTVDFYQRIFRPHETPEHYARTGRVLTVCWGVGCTVLALFAGKLGELALAFLKVSSFVCGPLLGIFLLGALTKRTTSRGALIGGAAGAAAVIVLTVLTNWSFLYLSTIGVALSVLCGYLASFLEAPPAAEAIESYVLTD